MAAAIRSMKKYLSLLEAQVKAAEDILATKMPQDTSQLPSPRVLKRLEEVEEKLKA